MASRGLTIFSFLLASASFCFADEVDDLVKQINPPARFANHTPDFTVEKHTFTLEFPTGPEDRQFWVVKDGPRYVALIPVKGGTIHLLTHNPDTAPRQLKLSRDRWLIETSIGTQLRTDAFIPPDEAEKESHYVFTKANGTLTLVRRFKGTTQFSTWTHKSTGPETIDATNTFVLRCHPVFGYIIEGRFDSAVKPAPQEYEYFSAATQGMCSVWATEDDVSHTVITPTYKPGFEGYGLNFAAIDLSDNDKSKFTCRDGGFAGFLNLKTGWSPVTTIQGSEAKLVVCNAHADLDFVTPWPADAELTPDGLSRRTLNTRVVHLPPEITKYVWDNMTMRFQGMSRVFIRIGVPDDFEDQPLPLTCSVRGLTSTGGGPKVSQEHAHSGKRSIVIEHGRFWPNLPQVPLKGNARYRLSAWIKLVEWTPEERKANEEKMRQKIEKDRQAGREVQDFNDFGPPEAYITADFYESSPHLNIWVQQMRTESVKPGDWQQVKLEFTALPWAPFVNIAFIANAGTAYVDDFELVEIKD